MILLVQPEYPPSVGGMQTHAVALANGLYKRGHSIAVVTYREAKDAMAAAEYDSAQPYPTYRILSRLSYWANLRLLHRLTVKLNSSIVYGSTPFYGLLAALDGIPVVCRSVGNDIMRCWVPYPFRLGSNLLAYPLLEQKIYALYRRLGKPNCFEDVLFSARRELVRRAACAASAVIANSDFTRDRLLEVGVSPAAVNVVSGGVDTARFAVNRRPELRERLSLGRKGPVLLTVCRLVEKKGVDLLLKAVAIIKGQIPTVALVIVGDGPEKEKCERLAVLLGLGDTVRFIGRVPHGQIVEYYHAADCFVLASRSHRRNNGWADVETMGRVLCEANAAGIPVVAADTGGTRSIIRNGENGILVPADDAEALAAAVLRLWNEPELRVWLRDSGLKRARAEFDWDVIVGEFERIIGEAAGDGVGGSF
ncbi:MAG: glycosyltransferase family 4 protein [Dehalococcoidia bacterium]|nr:glycosyltransferase family 4 protein [Dehalococcoidia bacterium]